MKLACCINVKISLRDDALSQQGRRHKVKKEEEEVEEEEEEEEEEARAKKKEGGLWPAWKRESYSTTLYREVS